MLTDILNYLKSGIAMWLKWIKPRSLLFALKIALATLLVWPLLSWLGIDHPVWAVVTIAAVSDPDVSATRTLVRDRVSNTLIGCAVALLTVWSVGATLLSLATALTLSVVLATSIAHFPANWRVTPITVAILLGSAVGEPPALALQFAGLRASEIIAGSLTALWLAWLFPWLLERQPVWPFWWGRLRLRWGRR